MRHSLILIVMLSFFALLSGCQSARRKNAEQQIVPAESHTVLGDELTRNLDRAYGVWSEPQIESTLNAMITKIAAADSAYAKTVSDARVHLLATATPYIAAGLNKTIYVSKGLLMGVVYENELAFLLGQQLALIKDGAPTKSVASLQGESVGESLIVLPTTPPDDRLDFVKKGWFEPGGLFDFGNDAYLKSEKEAIALVYHAKYDPRGAVTLIQRWDSPEERRNYRPLGKILPEVEERLTTAREEVAKLSPVRDPIVRSLAFEEMQGRLHSNQKSKMKAKHKKHGN